MKCLHGVYSPLHMEYIDRKNVKLLMPFVYECTVHQKRIVVPAGFISDGASVHILRTIGMFGLHSLLVTYGKRAAIVHDYLYRTPGLGYSKSDTDEIYYSALRADGVSKWRAWLLYSGVRWFGQAAWLRYGHYK